MNNKRKQKLEKLYYFFWTILRYCTYTPKSVVEGFFHLLPSSVNVLLLINAIDVWPSDNLWLFIRSTKRETHLFYKISFLRVISFIQGPALQIIIPQKFVSVLYAFGISQSMYLVYRNFSQCPVHTTFRNWETQYKIKDLIKLPLE